MAASSLTRTGETPPSIRKGHGTAELGPTDSTDSGSDVRGGPGFRGDDRLGSTPGSEGEVEGAGPDLGDRDLDSDSDRSGTGERASSGRDDAGPVDQTLHDDLGNVVEGEDIGDDDSALDTTLQERDERGQAQPRRRDASGDVERGEGEDSARGRRNEPV